MKKMVRVCQWQILLSAFVFHIGLTEIVWAREVTLSSIITYEIKDGFYVDKGADDGLRQSCIGSIRFENGSMLEFEVLHVTRKTALLRLVSAPAYDDRLVGQSVELIFEQTLIDQNSKDDKNESSADTDDDKFIPLLSPPEWSVGLPQANNIFHGQINIRETLQKDNEDLLNYSVTHLGSSGSLDRIYGSRWSFEWSGDIAYRDGDAYRYNRDYKDARLDLYQASFQRPLGEGGLFRFGRFLPRELPGIGYVDGVQGQVSWSEHWRLGTVAGFKPDRYNLDPSGDEPLIAAYTSFNTGDRKLLYYSGTAGILGSLYKNKADRLALLVDQRMNVGSSFSVNSTAQVDFDVGSAETKTGTRLTRLDVSSISKVSSRLTFRAGLDHWERPDNQAERDLLAIEDERLFDSGYWRYWIGSDQDLFWNLRFSEQVTLIESPEYDYDPRWSIGLTHTGLLSLSEAYITATVFNLQSKELDGYGVRLSAYLPVLKHKLFFQPIAGFRILEANPQSEDFAVNYISLRLNGRLSPNLTLFGGSTYSYGDNIDSNLINLGLRFAW